MALFENIDNPESHPKHAIDAGWFICARCGGRFEAGRSETECQAEKEQYFGDIPDDECATVCDACWSLVRPDRN